MKKQTILLLLLFVQLSSWSQSSGSGACTDELVQNSKGIWVKNGEGRGSGTKVQQDEAFRRMEDIHQILLNMYPNPVGVDIMWLKGMGGTGHFGSRVKYRNTRDNVRTFDFTNQLPLVSYNYNIVFKPYFCQHTHEGVFLKPGRENLGSKGITISANKFDELIGEGGIDDWTIDGLPVRTMSPLAKEKWNGYEVHVGEFGSSLHLMLIHRKGILPYKPVSRKVYLEYCIKFHTAMHDESIKRTEQLPVRSLAEQEAEKNARLAKFEKDFGKDPKRLKSAVDYYLSGYQTDQQRRDEQVQKGKRIKEEELKKFTDELAKTTREGLLDSPAVVQVSLLSDPIFTTDPEKGQMIVTHNPEYFRKDLSGHVPQFFVMSWIWSDYPPHRKYEKKMLEEFPIEKLQAMIDK